MKPIYENKITRYPAGYIAMFAMLCVIALTEIMVTVRRWFGKGDLV